MFWGDFVWQKRMECKARQGKETNSWLVACGCLSFFVLFSCCFLCDQQVHSKGEGVLTFLFLFGDIIMSVLKLHSSFINTFTLPLSLPCRFITSMVITDGRMKKGMRKEIFIYLTSYFIYRFTPFRVSFVLYQTTLHTPYRICQF